MKLILIMIVFTSSLCDGAVFPMREKVLSEADKILDLANVSYVYGGAKLGNTSSCDACTACLKEKEPHKDERLKACPECNQCSLDCSHFISLVFTNAGLRASYLTTKEMNEYTAARLKNNYLWVDLGNQVGRILPGDLLVYQGHVVLVEDVIKNGYGQVIHATSGSEVKGPGNGIQRQTLVEFGNYKGPLLRILRHKDLLSELKKVKAPKAGLRTKL